MHFKISLSPTNKGKVFVALLKSTLVKLALRLIVSGLVVVSIVIFVPP